MMESTRRGMKEGLEFGLLAGLSLAAAQIAGTALGAVTLSDEPVSAVRMFASVVLGRAALDTTSFGVALLVGGIAHLLLSALFGLVYGLFAGQLPAQMLTNRRKQAWLGLCFGATLWLVNFQIIALILYPWLLRTSQLLQLMMHALFFGLPLALMFSAAEGRAHANHSTPAPVHTRV